jgi:hypothetical protein
VTESSIVQLARNLARLVNVEMYEQAELGIVAIAFEFDGGTLHARANGEDDTFAWIDAIDHALSKVATTRAQKVWQTAPGKNLMWCWEMTNHQGYFDAVHLEFDTPSLNAATTVQIKVTASTLHFFHRTEVR